MGTFDRPWQKPSGPTFNRPWLTRPAPVAPEEEPEEEKSFVDRLLAPRKGFLGQLGQSAASGMLRLGGTAAAGLEGLSEVTGAVNERIQGGGRRERWEERGLTEPPFVPDLEKKAARAGEALDSLAARVDPYTSQGNTWEQIKKEPLKAIPKHAFAALPQMGGVVAASTLGGPAAGFAAAAGLEGARALVEDKETVPLSRRAPTALLQGALGGALEATGVARILNPGVATTIGKAGVLELLRTAAADVVGASLTEGGTEGFQEINAIGWELVRRGELDEVSWARVTDEFLPRVAAATTIGAAIGGPARAAAMPFDGPPRPEAPPQYTPEQRATMFKMEMWDPDNPDAPTAHFGYEEGLRRTPPEAIQLVQKSMPKLAILQGTPLDLTPDVNAALATFSVGFGWDKNPDPGGAVTAIANNPAALAVRSALREWRGSDGEVERIFHRYTEMATQAPPETPKDQLFRAAVEDRHRAGEVFPLIEEREVDVEPDDRSFSEGGWLRLSRGNPAEGVVGIPGERTVGGIKVPAPTKVWAAKVFTNYGKFAAAGKVAKGLYEIEQTAQRAATAEVQVANTVARRFSRTLGKYLEGAFEGGVPLTEEETLSYIVDGLEGRNQFETLPPELVDVSREMRGHIDRLSGELLDSSLLTDKLREVIKDNQGVYLRRTYEAFRTNPDKWLDFVQNVQPWRWENAMQFMRDEDSYARLHSKVDRPPKTDNQLGADLAGYIRGHESVGPALAARTGVLPIDQSIFARRKNLPTALEDLFGLDQDPVVRYFDGVSRMAFNIHQDQALQDMGALLETEGLLQREAGPDGRWRQVPVLSRSMSQPGAPVQAWVPDNVADVIEAQYAMGNSSGLVAGGLKAYLAMVQVSSMAKANVTVWNPGGQVRNVLAWPFIWAAQGKLIKSAGSAPRAAATVMHNVFAGTSVGAVVDRFAASLGMDVAALEGFMKEAVEAGVMGESTGREVDYQSQTRSIKRLLGQDPEGIGATELFDRLKATREGKVLAGVRRIAHGLYQGGDDFGKLALWDAEIKDHLSSYGLDATNPEHVAQAKAAAAKKVRRITPTYSETPAIVSELSKFPLVAPFIKWSYEVSRSQYIETPRLAFEEMVEAARTGNDRLMKVGAKRLAGALAIPYALPAAITMAARALVGMGFEEEREARKLLPFYLKYSTLLWVGRQGKKFQLINLGFTLPHEAGTEIMRSALIEFSKTGTVPEKILAAGQGTLEAVWASVGWEVAWGAAKEIIDNSKVGSGQPVYPENMGVAPAAREIGRHVYERLGPGYVKTLEEIARAGNIEPEALPKYDRYGNEYSYSGTVARMFGGKVLEGDWLSQLGQRAGAFEDARQKSGTHEGTEARNFNTTPDLRRRALAEANVSRRRAWQDMLESTKAAQTQLEGGGYSRARAQAAIRQHLRDSRFNQDYIELFLAGQEEPPADYLGLKKR